MCIAMNLYLLPVYDLVVMQVLAAQQDLNSFKVTIDYYLITNDQWTDWRDMARVVAETRTTW